VTGSRCDLLRCGAAGGPESNHGMPEIVRPKGSDPRCLCRWQSEPPTPTRETNRAAGRCREYPGTKCDTAERRIDVSADRFQVFDACEELFGVATRREVPASLLAARVPVPRSPGSAR
jgi:hypothetical protein